MCAEPPCDVVVASFAPWSCGQHTVSAPQRVELAMQQLAGYECVTHAGKPDGGVGRLAVATDG